MRGRCPIAIVCVRYAVIALFWGAQSFALAAENLGSLSEPPSEPVYEKLTASQYAPLTQGSFATMSAPKPMPRLDDAAREVADEGQQVGRDSVSSKLVALPADPSKAGLSTIVGRVLFRGAILPATQVEVNRDAAICGQFVNLQPISVDPTTGGLRNAVVHVEVEQAEMPAGTSRDLLGDVLPVRNKNCTFFPRIGAGRTGSEAEIINDDPLMHNTNMTTGNRTVLNVAMVAGGSPIRKQLKNPGLHVVKCNVHKFMYGYRYVFDDVFYDMTSEAGQFRISNLPPGFHTVTVWHETLGTMQKEVQVPARGTVSVDFEFK